MSRYHRGEADHGTQMRHIIIKQGYLKKLANSARLASTIRKPDRRWFVFGVLGGSGPYLEYYRDEDAVFTDRPINTISLAGCSGVEGGGQHPRYEHGFTLELPDRRLTLVAQTSESSNEWILAIRSKLQALRIINRGGHATSVDSNYISPSLFPPNPLRASLPLPCTPVECGLAPDTRRSAALPPAYSPTGATSPAASLTSPVASLTSPAASLPPMSPGLPPPEVYYLASPTSPKADEAGVGGGGGGGEAVGGWSAPPPGDAHDAPPPYARRKLLLRGAQTSLRRTQAEGLQHERSSPGGATVRLRYADIANVLALVDGFNAVWIAGWCQRMRPFLHNVFHIGDQIISVNSQVVENAKMARKLIKVCSLDDMITFVFHRLPRAEVFVLQRTAEGEDIGIRREGGSAEIIYVDVGGLAGQQGMRGKATTMDGDNLCNWWITEVNNRPLNLFFKESEVEHRLNSVGKEISLVIQPSQLILELRRQLKFIKNYKEFIVQ